MVSVKSSPNPTATGLLNKLRYGLRSMYGTPNSNKAKIVGRTMPMICLLFRRALNSTWIPTRARVCSMMEAGSILSIPEAMHCDGPAYRPDEYAERMIEFFDTA